MEQKLNEILNQLKQIVNRLEILEDKQTKLKEWSDLNDYWLKETVKGLTESVNKLMGITEEEVGGPYIIER